MRPTFALASAFLFSAALAGMASAEERVVLSYPLFGPEPTHRIVAVDTAKRLMRIETKPGAPAELFEGSGGILLASIDGGPLDSLVRVDIDEILDGGVAVATFGPGAAKVVRAADAILLRPIAGRFDGEAFRQAPTKAIRGLPDLLSTAAPRPGEGNPLDRVRAAARRSSSSSHLKQLALALHIYHDAHSTFPPAAVIGPDGRPWHSWRVLVLPYLEENGLYERYDFSQPWDSPKNLAVAEKMPTVFRDPAREGPADTFTDYAAITGAEAIFRPATVKMKTADDFPACLAAGKKTPLASITDGTSNTIMVATVDPARKIPWTKPEDIVFDDNFPGIGKPAGIGAIHPVGDARFGLAAFADGSVQTLVDSIDADTLRPFLTRAGGEVVDRSLLLAPGVRDPAAAGPPLVKIIADQDGRLRLEVD